MTAGCGHSWRTSRPHPGFITADAPMTGRKGEVHMLSFHRCIVPTNDFADDTYLNNLELRDKQKQRLLGARTLARQALRAAFRKETAAFFGDETPITPSFFTQGSWGYNTINRPTWVPPQQTDMDDGCYL